MAWIYCCSGAWRPVAVECFVSRAEATVCTTLPPTRTNDCCERQPRQDVHGPTGEHPAVAATDEVSSLALESTPRDGETGEELRKAVTEDEPDDPLSEIGVPQANSDNTTTGTEGGTAEESPPAEPDRSLDAPVLGFEIPHAVTDAGAAADILEGMTAGVSPPPVPPGIQSETAPLVAEDESTGSVDETVVTPRSGNGFRNEGVSERPQVALVPQTEAASGASEDSPLLPKHEEEEAINAPATSISSDEGVEATPEAYQVGQMAEAVEVGFMRDAGWDRREPDFNISARTTETKFAIGCV